MHTSRIEQGQIPVDEALNIALQIADGLDVAHEQGIRHPNPTTAADYALSGSGTLVYAPGGGEDVARGALVWVDRAGQFGVWVQGYPDGAPVRVSRSGGHEAHWSADGKELFYLRENAMMAEADARETGTGLAGIRKAAATSIPRSVRNRGRS